MSVILWHREFWMAERTIASTPSHCLVLAGMFILWAYGHLIGKHLSPLLTISFLTWIWWRICAMDIRGSSPVPFFYRPLRIRCLRAWLSVLQLPLPTLSLQSGVSKAKEFSLGLLLEQASIKVSICLLEGFYGNCKGSGERGMSGSCAVLYPSSYSVFCYTTVAFSLASCPAA